MTERLGFDRHEHVVDVQLAERRRVRRVGSDERAAGPQHTVHLAEEPILQLRRRDVMEHREARHRAEPVVGKARCCGVAVDDLDVGAGEAGCECDRQGVIDLQRDEAADLPVQQVGGETGAGPDLEHVVAEVGGAEHPRQQVVLEVLLPARTGEEL